MEIQDVESVFEWDLLGPSGVMVLRSKLSSAPCCRSLVGCSICIREWVRNSPKCRNGHFGDDFFFFLLNGMEDVLAALHAIISELNVK